MKIYDKEENVVEQTIQEESINQNIPDKSLLYSIEVKDGALSFNSYEQFESAIYYFGNMTDSEFQEVENQLGYTSLRTIQINALDKLNKLGDDDEKGLYEWLDKYSDLYKLEYDENGEETIVERVSSSIYSKLCSEESVYFTNNEINKVIDNSIITASINEVKDLNNINDLNDAYSNKLKVFEFNSCNEKGYYTSFEKEGEKNLSGCRNDRKVKLKMEVTRFTYAQPPIYYNIAHKVEVTVKGYDKVSCIYFPYKTILSYYSVSGNVYSNGNHYFNIGSKTTSSDEYSLSTTKDAFSLVTDDQDEYNSYMGYYFQRAYGKGGSRGTDGIYAIIDYTK